MEIIRVIGPKQEPLYNAISALILEGKYDAIVIKETNESEIKKYKFKNYPVLIIDDVVCSTGEATMSLINKIRKDLNVRARRKRL